MSGLIELGEELADLEGAFGEYRDRLSGLSVEAANDLQRGFSGRFAGFFEALKSVERAVRAQEKAIAGLGKSGTREGMKAGNGDQGAFIALYRLAMVQLA